MDELGLIGILIIGVNVFISYKGFKSISFFEKYKFNIDRILIFKEYRRLLTSGFLHANWNHLIFNMISLFLFSSLIETH
jgi:membrane associated rhomboid family serine protease